MGSTHSKEKGDFDRHTPQALNRSIILFSDEVLLEM